MLRMLCRRTLAAVPVALCLAAPAQSLASAHRRGDDFHPPATASVSGTVSTPASYRLGQLATQPQTTFIVTSRDGWRTRTDIFTGVNLESLVSASAPVAPNAKNALLSVTLDVRGVHGPDVALAFGELDASFGNHPAYLAVTENGHRLQAPELVVPGDANGPRTVPAVRDIDVAVQSPSATAPSQPGGLLITDGSISRALSAAQLAALPQQTLSVSFYSGTTLTTATEVGPTLASVLRAARFPTGLDSWVAGVGDDDHVAVVTPAETSVGGRPLLISLNENGTALAEPRLVVDGDVKGGRYVSGLYDLVVGGSTAPSFPFHWQGFEHSRRHHTTPVRVARSPSGRSSFFVGAPSGRPDKELSRQTRPTRRGVAVTSSRRRG